MLQALLDEQVPIRDLVRIFEALSLRAKASTDLDGLVEAARLALGPALAAVQRRGGLLQVLTLDPIAEQQLRRVGAPGRDGRRPGPAARAWSSGWSTRPRPGCASAEDLGHSPVLVCAAPLRAPLSRLLRTSAPRLPVLSYAEIDPSLRIETLGVIAHADALVA